jgi:hypothetical protein
MEHETSCMYMLAVEHSFTCNHKTVFGYDVNCKTIHEHENLLIWIFFSEIKISKVIEYNIYEET